MFVYINNTEEMRSLDWSHYKEFVSGPVSGVNVLTGENVTLQDGVQIEPRSALIVDMCETQILDN